MYTLACLKLDIDSLPWSDSSLFQKSLCFKLEKFEHVVLSISVFDCSRS